MEELYTNSQIKELEGKIAQNQKVVDGIYKWMHIIVWCVAGIILLICLGVLHYDYDMSDMSFIIILVEIIWTVSSYEIQLLIVNFYAKSIRNDVAEIKEIRERKTIEEEAKRKEEEAAARREMQRLTEAKANEEKLAWLVELKIKEEDRAKMETQRLAEAKMEREKLAREEELARLAVEKANEEKLAREEELVRLAEAKAEREKKESQQVADTSPLYKSLIELNKSFVFEKIDRVHNYHVELASKQQLEKLDVWESFKYTMENDELYYTALLKQLSKNTDLWDEYNTKYRKNWVYTEQSQIEGMTLDQYQEYEMQLYDSNKIAQPIIDVTINIEAIYTSPSGRNTYTKSATCSKSQMYSLLEEIKENREDDKKRAEQAELERVEQQEKKRILAEKKRLNEQKLRELDKREMELNKKQKEIEAREKEFLLATKGNIYSVEPQQTLIANKPSNSLNDTPIAKLEKLKVAFNNGEITYDEYSRKRRELL